MRSCKLRITDGHPETFSACNVGCIYRDAESCSWHYFYNGIGDGWDAHDAHCAARDGWDGWDGWDARCADGAARDDGDARRDAKFCVSTRANSHTIATNAI